MAGFNLHKMEPWIKEYLENPDFIDYTDYYVKRATSVNNAISEVPGDSQNETADQNELLNKTDQEINEMLYLDEYFFERFHSSSNRRRNDHKKSADVAKRIHAFIKYSYTNPLSLKELSRISIRKSLLSIDYKMKFKIEHDLPLPNRLKNYLQFKEFAIWITFWRHLVAEIVYLFN